MFERDQIMLNLYRKQLVHSLLQLKQRPYLPVWGELFDSLHQIRALAHKYEQDIHLYDIYPTGELLYHLNKQMFMVKIEELHTYIYMDIHECIDYLISGKFSPFPKA